MDGLLQTIAVQGVWLNAKSPTRAAGSKRPHVCLHSPGHHVFVRHRMWDKEQLLWWQHKGQEYHPSLRGEFVSANIFDHTHPCQLGGLYRHQQVLQPTGGGCWETGAREGPLPWLVTSDEYFAHHQNHPSVQLQQSQIKGGRALHWCISPVGKGWTWDAYMRCISHVG